MVPVEARLMRRMLSVLPGLKGSTEEKNSGRGAVVCIFTLAFNTLDSTAT